MGHYTVHVEHLARRGCRVQAVRSLTPISHCRQISENHSPQIPGNFTVLLLQQQRREREARRQQEREQRRREQEEKRRLEELERRRKEEEERRRAEEEKRRVEREQVSLSNRSVCCPVELGTGSQMYSPVCMSHMYTWKLKCLNTLETLTTWLLTFKKNKNWYSVETLWN